MNKAQYIIEIQSDIVNLLQDYRLNNYKKQVFAWKLNASFRRTFEETYLLNRALFLSTNSCILLQNNSNEKPALKGLYESAEIYEYISELPEISQKIDKDYLTLLSALCYDLSGYQANAYCVANRINEYILNSYDSKIDLAVDNEIIEQIRLILLKKIPFAYQRLSNQNHQDLGFQLFKKSLTEWFEFILKLIESDYLSSLGNVYEFFLNSGNTYLSHLIFLLQTRILLMKERGIWNNLNSINNLIEGSQWKKYVKLLAQDYYSENSIKDIKDRNSIFEFWTSQLRAIESGLISTTENFVVQMPTSAGKTFIAELSILKYLIQFPSKKCIYIAPFRALTNEKEIELSKYFSKLGFSVSSLSGSYEIDEFQDVILSETDLLIATPEKIDLLLRLSPDFFYNISFIVVDEGHIIGNYDTRATLLEFLIIRLKIKIPDLKTLFISAVMPPLNANEYALWLSGNEANVLRSLKFKDSSIEEEWEPTRKLIGSFKWDGDNGKIVFKNINTEDENTRNTQEAFIPFFLVEKQFGNRYPKKNSHNEYNKLETTAALAYKLTFEGNTLVFCAQPRQTEWVYKRIKQILNVESSERIPIWFSPIENRKSFHYAKIWYGENHYITEAIKYGIGIHYGDMPEQVRSSVENDYRKGNLRLLISSNTIGQGLNFPIKNLVFYSIQIGQNVYIEKRDFWNIVGRAGRAGKETEGKIIFVINSYTDETLFKEYSNKGNIEEADSLIFNALKALTEGRLSQNDFSNILSILSEPYLLDLLTEEIVGTEYEDVIESIIGNSLFKIQIDKRNLDISPIRNGFKSIFKSFEVEESFDKLAVFRTTGFSFRSNQIIDEYINNNIEEIQQIIQNEDYLGICHSFLKMISEKDINELADTKLSNLNINPIDIFNIISQWINGIPIQILIASWKDSTDNDISDFHIFISKALNYLYPWGMTSYLVILANLLDIELVDFPEDIRNLTSYIKFGLNNPTSCLARSLGIKSRQVSLLLFKQSNHLQGKDFIKWLSNLNNDEIESFDISAFDKENVNEVALKLTPNSLRTSTDRFEFRIKGTYYNPTWRKNSLKVQSTDTLKYIREYKNDIDPYAILILKGVNPIGYVPREYSKLISSEIDIEESEYEIFISNIYENKDFNDIEVVVNKRQ